MLPNLSGTARLTADPELRYSPSGMAVTKVNMAFNARRRNPAGEWEDGDVFYVAGTAFKEHAENLAESLQKGSEVVVTGRLKTRSWADDSGQKHSRPELLIDTIGPSLRWVTATIATVERTRSAPEQEPGGPDDPWAAA